MPFITTWFKAKVDETTITDDFVAGLRLKEQGVKIIHLNDEVRDYILAMAFVL